MGAYVNGPRRYSDRDDNTFDVVPPRGANLSPLLIAVAADRKKADDSPYVRHDVKGKIHAHYTHNSNKKDVPKLWHVRYTKCFSDTEKTN